MPVLHLTDARRAAFDALARDLQHIFGARFVALAAHGPRSSVAFAESIALADLAAAARHADRWRRNDLDVPLLITTDEFRRSLDAFPVEYGAILHRHAVIAGTPPFDGATVAGTDLRRALEVQAKGHVLHLRAGAIATGGRVEQGRALVAASIEPFRALLANVARLDGAPAADDAGRNDDAGDHGAGAAGDAALARHAAALLDMPEDTLRGLLAIDDESDFDPSAVMPVCLEAAERLWSALDAWKARAR